MKRFITVLTMLVLCVPVFAQKPIQGKMTEKTQVLSWLTFTSYPKAYLFSDEDNKHPVECEIAYNSTTGLYSVYVKDNNVVRNCDVRYHSATPSEDGANTMYMYTGTNLVSNERVVITTRTKLSLYTKNCGFRNVQEANFYEGILLMFPGQFVMLSLTPVVN